MSGRVPLRQRLALAAAFLLVPLGPFYAAETCHAAIRKPSGTVIGERKRPGHLLTPGEAAAAVGIPENVLRAELRSRSLRAAVRRGLWRIDPDDLAAWRKSARGRAIIRENRKNPQNPGSTGMPKKSAKGRREPKRTENPGVTNPGPPDTVAAVTTTPSDVAADPEFLTVKEAMALARCSRDTIENYVADGRLGDYGIVGRRLIKTAELRAIIARGPTPKVRRNRRRDEDEADS